ncbi:capsid assembly scaffolding protein Gp46 family protein [Listeria ilorinensis]|uniref:capsid assembly scaffolding protein Gp46 family protein n=1 Tax=Listeria ilorinensis TaxID=2867439 RepID=UPI001EF43056|nr:DUF4355 domain-containing protein [Listeria ilorinensis]
MYKNRHLFFMDAETGGGEGGEASGQGSEGLTWDSVKTFLESDETAKKNFNSMVDSANRSAVEAFKTQSMPKLIEEAVKKRSAVDPMQSQLDELTQKFEEEKAMRMRSEIVAQLSVEAAEIGLDADIAKDFCVGDDQETSTEKLKRLNGYIEQKAKDKADEIVRDRFAGNYGKKQTQTAGDDVQKQNNNVANQSSLGLIQNQISQKFK